MFSLTALSPFFMYKLSFNFLLAYECFVQRIMLKLREESIKHAGSH